MNRRKPIKKDYLAIFSKLPSRWVILPGLFILGTVIAIWIIQATYNSSTPVESEDIVAVFAMITIPLLILFATYKFFEKFTGLSIIAGVEWVGKNTLAIIDWSISTVQRNIDQTPNSTKQAIGVEPDKNRTQQLDTLSAEELLVEPFIESTDTDKSEPVFSDFTSKEEQDLELAHAISDRSEEHYPQQLFDSESTEQRISNSQILDEVRGSEVFTDSIQDVDSEVFSENVHQDLQPEEALESTFNELETELKSFFYDQKDEHGKLDSERTKPEYEGSAETNPALELSKDFPESRSNDNFEEVPESPDKKDYMISALQAAKANKTFPVSGNSGSEQTIADISVPVNEDPILATDPMLNKTDYIIRTLQETAKEKLSQTEDGFESVQETPLNTIASEHTSLLEQAEQTAANLFSSFSEKFGRSFVMHEKPEYKLPAIDLLKEHKQSVYAYTSEELDEMARSVERVLKDYKVIAEVAGAYPGPIITRFELSLAPGVKVSRVSGLAKDLARAMLVTSVRVVEIIEGTPYIGLEIPNQERELVSFREIISSEQFQNAKSPITLALGKDVSGQTVVSNLAKMPHLLVAGTTGSGKSVAINTMILSMLYKATPDQVRMIMVDPKMLELSIYEGIPHLLTPVVTDMKEAQNALRWAVAEMERRYKLMSKVGVRNLSGFNQKIKDAASRGATIRDPLFELLEPLPEGQSFPVLTTLPSIVIVIDELADMMMIVGKKVEELIARLAQKARAAGIHLILATQRPSVDVLTGLIKANVPTRISFQVSSRIDSRTILDQGGAEALLGNGDMLFLPSGTSVPTRSHGAFVADEEVHAVVNYLKSLGAANYLPEITQEAAPENTSNTESVLDEVDALYDEAVSFVLETGRASISSVQRRFKVGYNRAARMIDQMEENNIVSEPEGNGSRRIINRDQ